MHQGTRDTYNQSAGLLSSHYDAIGSRDGDINLAFSLAGNPQNAQVLEIGCGNGRDARAVLRKSPFYFGIDTSEKMIEIAKAKVPKGEFIVADALTYEYNGPYTIILAFALLRHVAITELSGLLLKIANSLEENGILYVSSIYSDTYHEDPRTDTYGTRCMHYYNPDVVLKYCPPNMVKVHEMYETIAGVEWFEVALKKKATR